jgi:hypothetical protein
MGRAMGSRLSADHGYKLFIQRNLFLSPCNLSLEPLGSFPTLAPANYYLLFYLKGAVFACLSDKLGAPQGMVNLQVNSVQ